MKKSIISVLLAVVIALSATCTTAFSVCAAEEKTKASSFSENKDKTDDVRMASESSLEAAKGYKYIQDKNDSEKSNESVCSVGADNSANWSLNDGRLTISGNGSLDDIFQNGFPWLDRKSEITSVVFESGITETGTQSFAECENIESIELSNTVTVVSNGSFYGCTSLKEIALPDSVTHLYAGAFADCSSLSSVSYSNLQVIGAYAFQNTKIKDVFVGKSVSTLSPLAFFDCNINSYTVEEGNTEYKAFDGVLYSFDMKTITAYPTYDQKVNFDIPSSVTKVGQYAFMGNSSLKSITIPYSVTELGEGAFCRCNQIESVEIPDSVNIVGNFTFEECYSLKTAKLGNGLESAPYRMFYECVNLESIDFGTGVEKLNAQTFAYCRSLKSVTLPKNIVEIGNSCFGCCYNLESFTSENLSKIPYQCFFYCEKLTELSLNEGVTDILRASFGYCNALSQVTLPESTTYVHPYAFPQNTKIICTNTEVRQFGVNGYRRLQDISITGENNYTYAFEVLELVNNERTAAGLPKLVMNESLLNTAMTRAAEISALFSHTRPDSSLCLEANPLMIAENIAALQSSPQSVMESWMNSSGHKENIMSDEFSSIGIGCFKINGMYFWTQCFGATDDSEDCAVQQNREVTQKISLACETFREALVGYGLYFGGKQDEYTFSFNLIPEKDELDAGEQTRVELYLKNPGDKFTLIPVNNDGISWSSSDANIANADEKGNVTALSKGTAEIKAELKYFSASSTVNVISDAKLTGDVNDDKCVNIEDATLIQKYCAALISFNENQKTVADFNKDGDIDISDATQIQKYILN